MQRVSRRLLAIWIGLVGLLIILQVFPIRSGIVKLSLTFVVIAVWVGAILLVRKRPLFRLSLVVIPLVMLAWVALPGKSADSGALRRAYTRSLSGYRGALYVWGGELRSASTARG